MSAGGSPSWFERNAGPLFWALVVACALVVGADLFIHRHGHFAFENIPAFHAGFGFIVFVVVVYAGKGLRRLVMRDEDYYD